MKAVKDCSVMFCPSVTICFTNIVNDSPLN